MEQWERSRLKSWKSPVVGALRIEADPVIVFTDGLWHYVHESPTARDADIINNQFYLAQRNASQGPFLF